MTEAKLQFEEGRFDFVWECNDCAEKQARGTMGFHLINHVEKRCNFCAKCKRLADAVGRQDQKKRLQKD